RVGLAAELLQCLAGLSGVVLDFGLELDCRLVEIGALERLAGSSGSGERCQDNGRKGSERGDQADADMREHRLSSSSPRGGNFRRGDHESTSPNHVEVVTET